MKVRCFFVNGMFFFVSISNGFVPKVVQWFKASSTSASAHCYYGNSVRSWHVRICSSCVLVLLMSYYLNPTLLQRIQPDSTNVLFLHLVTFAFHFGAQCWVTFIAGILMFLNLPRVMFGHLQTRMFPAYFFTTLVMSSITLVTYTIRHPYQTWTQAQEKQGGLLILCVISTFINASILAPGIVQTMTKVFSLEKSKGIGHEVGYAERSELKKNPDYRKHYIKFRIYHGLSGLANLGTLICNTMYLYHLACMCVYLDLQHMCKSETIS